MPNFDGDEEHWDAQQNSYIGNKFWIEDGRFKLARGNKAFEIVNNGDEWLLNVEKLKKIRKISLSN